MNYKAQLEERYRKLNKYKKPFACVVPPPSDCDIPFILMDCKLTKSQIVSNFEQPSKSNSCYKCIFLRRVWMVAVNLYDFLGLLDICPCGTLHPISPYII